MLHLVAASVVLYALAKGVLIYCQCGLLPTVIYVILLAIVVPIFYRLHP